MAARSQDDASQPLLVHAFDTTQDAYAPTGSGPAVPAQTRASVSSESCASVVPAQDTGAGRKRRHSFSTDKAADHDRVIYKYRFVVLALFCLVSGINGFQYMVPSTITAQVVQYYGVSDLMVNGTAMLFYLLCTYFSVASSTRGARWRGTGAVWRAGGARVCGHAHRNATLRHARRFHAADFPLAGPAMWLLDHKGTRRCVVLASALNFLGGLARVFAWSPTKDSFLWMLAGSVLLSVSAPLFFR